MTQYSLVWNESDIKPRTRVAGEKPALSTASSSRTSARAGKPSAKHVLSL
jgi:hypothetical protein